MIVDEFQHICHKLGFTFNYGKEHWQNLEGHENDADKVWELRKKHLLLLFVDSKKKVNEHNAIIGEEYSGAFIISVRSRIDDKDYNFKYERHIKALEREIRKVFKEFDSCDETWEIRTWNETEVENQLDTTLDGKRVTFNLFKEINDYRFFEPDSEYFGLTTLLDLVERHEVQLEDKECLINNYQNLIQ